MRAQIKSNTISIQCSQSSRPTRVGFIASELWTASGVGFWRCILIESARKLGSWRGFGGGFLNLNRYASKGARFQAPCSTEALWLDLVASLYLHRRRFGALCCSASAAGSIGSSNSGTAAKKFVLLLDQGRIFDDMIWALAFVFCSLLI